MHPFTRRCNLCELAGRYSVIGDGQYRCQVCGGVEFGLVRRKSLIRWLIEKARRIGNEIPSDR